MDTDTHVTYHRPLSSVDKHIAVFYIHGGGLLYGERNDLPTPYIRMFTDAGYTLICADYPLAPETPYAGIVTSLQETLAATAISGIEDGNYDGYILFGRSAGANLALVLAREIAINPSCPQPLGIIDFYGYYDLCDETFEAPAKAYAKLPTIEMETVKRITSNGGIPFSGPKALRYALYVYARQHEGTWLSLMGLDGTTQDRDPAAWSLSDSDIAALPPLFIAASSGDEDIPLRISKSLSRKAPNAKMKTVYYLPHDFDRDLSRPEGADTYREVIDWLSGLA